MVRNNSSDTHHTNQTENTREVKVVTVGETAVGKSSITLRFVHNHFKENNVATIGASFLSKSIYVKGWVKFNIWDTAGQEKYRSLASLYYRGVDCAIIVYDITNRVGCYSLCTAPAVVVVVVVVVTLNIPLYSIVSTAFF